MITSRLVIFTVHSILTTVRFTTSDIIAAINKLKPNLSSGPDRLPPLLYKKLKYCIVLSFVSDIYTNVVNWL